MEKGRLPCTEQQRHKLSSSHKGKHHTEETKFKIKIHSNNNREKAMNTIINKYGSLQEYYSQLIQKTNSSKKKNHTLNTSKVEKRFYEILCDVYGSNNVKTHYKESRYPYYCDFYIPSEDLFIELNAHWTHGGKPFNEQDSECIKKLDEWKSKAKTSQYFSNAIQTWTVRDVEKLKTASLNHLNYITIY